MGGSILTATSCEYNYDDPVVIVLKSATPDASPKALSCLGANDNSETWLLICFFERIRAMPRAVPAWRIRQEC